MGLVSIFLVRKGPVANFIRTCIEIHALHQSLSDFFGYLIFVVQFEYGFSIISGALALTVSIYHRCL